jgi:hypothetical protein
MKTTKFFLIAVLVSITAMTFSKSFDDSPRFAVKITLRCAMENPALVKVMHEQLNPDFLNNGDEAHFYTEEVRFRGILFQITGTYEQWKYFFSTSFVDPIPEG